MLLLFQLNHPTACFSDHCDDTDAKTNELTKAVEDLQGLLKKSSEQYGKLEEECEQMKKDNKEEITKRNEAIRTLKKELDDANGLLKASKSKGNLWSRILY